MRANHAYRHHSLRFREAAFIKCDVTKWDEQVALFELAIAQFGSVDIVVSVAPLVPLSGYRQCCGSRKHFAQVPNAGINENEQVCWGDMKFVEGKPVKPKLLTLEVNLTGVIYSEESPHESKTGPPPDS